MKRVKHFLLASCLFPALLGAQEMANANFLELTPDAQSAGMAGTGLAITDNGSTAIFHNASTIAFSQEAMGASYSYADINKDCALHSASLFYRIGREGIHGFALGFRHFKDPKIMDYRPRIWDLEAAYFRNVAKNLSLSLTFRYLQERKQIARAVSLLTLVPPIIGIRIFWMEWLLGLSVSKPPTWAKSWMVRNCLHDWDWEVVSTFHSTWRIVCK